MIKIVKEEIEIDESLVSRLNVICDFCNTTPIIENGSIRIFRYKRSEIFRKRFGI